METPQIEKITILFPPGDQLTSLLISKEANTKIADLLNRLCALRGIELDLKKFAVIDDLAKEVDLSKTVAESGLVFIDIVDKKEFKKEKKKIKEEFPYRGLPNGLTNTNGKGCYVPLEDQLFDDEKQSLSEFKLKNESLCKNFSDEFVVACLLARKQDHARALELLQNNLKWRKENNFLVLPKFEEIQKDLLRSEFFVVGTRDKGGRCIRYINLGWQPHVYPHTVPEMKRYYVWGYYIAIFSEGIDAIRNGVHVVVDMGNTGWRQFDLDFQRQMAPLWSQTFPLLVRKCSVLNAPVFMNAILKVMRTIVPAKVMDRIKVAKSTKSMTKVIEKSQLWNERGGELEWTPERNLAFLREWCDKNEERLRVEAKV